MNDSQLRAFVEVASCGSFSKAADKLFLSKQALKKQIDALEHELGFTLKDSCGGARIFWAILRF